MGTALAENIRSSNLKIMKDASNYTGTFLGTLGILTGIPAGFVLVPVGAGLICLSGKLENGTCKEAVEAKEIYDGIITDYNKINKDFGLEEPVSICSLADYAIQDGYFSVDKKYTFGQYDVKDIKGIGGANIMAGKGVCRHISALLMDIYNDYGMESYVIGVGVRGADFKIDIDLTKDGLSREELHSRIESLNYSASKTSFKKREIDRKLESVGEHVFIVPDFEKKPKNKVNHAINIVFHDGLVYFLDATQTRTYKLNRDNPKFLCDYFDDRINYDTSFIRFNSDYDASRVKEGILLPSTEIASDISVMTSTKALYKDNRDIFEKFYNEHKEGYQEVANVLRKIKHTS